MITGDPYLDESLVRFCRALRGEDVPICKDMLDRAAPRAGAPRELAPMERLALSILLAQEKDIIALRSAAPASSR